jgi:hypothetical protein
MRKALLLMVMAVMGVGLFLPSHAEARTQAQRESRAARKMQKRQQKAMKKYIKAQQKAQRKMTKYSRKHTHYPKHSY